MEEKRRVTVNILGVSYNIITDEDPQKVEAIAQYVDSAVKATKAAAPQMSNNHASILALMNTAEELFATRELLEAMKEKEEDFEKNLESVKQAEELKLELANADNRMKTLKNKAEKLQVENIELKDMLDEYKDKYNALRTEYELNKRTLNDLQSKFLENQIELVKVKKSLIDVQE
ncbi:MAG: cell division protein ZapA [Eubacteriaceae bacterium]|nr:cell division protein ZapA [Eubacteriaceae bacterium]MBR2779820.1 cell division protein ZapA [Eubacteriaceae bacterium]MCR4893347.1 cell division protein ZapA [Eubacteriales bacterium]